jgi:hypothetical protein
VDAVEWDLAAYQIDEEGDRGPDQLIVELLFLEGSFNLGEDAHDWAHEIDETESRGHNSIGNIKFIISFSANVPT